jgi:hypothetical protein
MTPQEAEQVIKSERTSNLTAGLICAAVGVIAGVIVILYWTNARTINIKIAGCLVIVAVAAVGYGLYMLATGWKVDTKAVMKEYGLANAKRVEAAQAQTDPKKAKDVPGMLKQADRYQDNAQQLEAALKVLGRWDPAVAAARSPQAMAPNSQAYIQQQQAAAQGYVQQAPQGYTPGAPVPPAQPPVPPVQGYTPPQA